MLKEEEVAEHSMITVMIMGMFATDTPKEVGIVITTMVWHLGHMKLAIP